MSLGDGNLNRFGMKSASQGSFAAVALLADHPHAMPIVTYSVP